MSGTEGSTFACVGVPDDSDYSIDRLAVPPLVGSALPAHGLYANRAHAAVIAALSERGHLLADPDTVGRAMRDPKEHEPAAPLYLRPHTVGLPRLDPPDLAVDAIFYLSLDRKDDRVVILRASVHPLVTEMRRTPDGGTDLRQVRTPAVWTQEVTIPASICDDPQGAVPVVELLATLPPPDVGKP